MILDDFRLDGRRALVTGASSGIGEAIGLALAEVGAEVVGLARRESCFSRSLLCDLADREQIRVAVAEAGEIDILVNAAGLNPRSLDEAAWDRTLAVNLTAPFLLARALAPAMQSRGWGRILNIASLQARLAFPMGMPYGASKGGLEQLTRAMAQHWSPVTANAIAPGFFRTPLTEPVFQHADIVKSLAARTALGRHGELRDLRGAALFLCSEASSYVTGQILFVDGGFTCT